MSMVDLEAVLADYRRDGFARLGRILDDGELMALRARADAVMLGEIVYPGLFFQHDSPSGDYDDLELGKGFIGPSLAYRKIEKLEVDPLFRALIEHPRLEPVVRAWIGPEASLYRAIFMNKAAHGGTVLPYHQDGGTFWGVDRAPDLQIWTALDDAPVEAGCVEVVPGSHARGLVTPLGGVVPADRVGDAVAVPLPAVAGESLLIHNHLWHRSGVNRTDSPRRAFSVCYMPASTRCLRKKRAPRNFVRVFTR